MIQPYQVVAGQMDLIQKSLRTAHQTRVEAEEVYDLITGLENVTDTQLEEVFGELSQRTLGRIQVVLDTFRDTPDHD